MSIDQRKRLGTVFLFGVSLPLTVAVLVIAGIVIATGGQEDGRTWTFLTIALVLVSGAFARLGRTLRHPPLNQ